MDTNELMKEALAYHAEGGPGKIEIRPTKPDATQYDQIGRASCRERV